MVSGYTPFRDGVDLRLLSLRLQLVTLLVFLGEGSCRYTLADDLCLAHTGHVKRPGMVFAALAGIPRPGFTLTRHLADGLYPRCDHLQHTGDYLADDSTFSVLVTYLERLDE